VTETEACIALNMIPKLGPVGVRRLLSALGSPQRILTATGAELRSVEGIGREISESILDWEKQVDLDSELRRIAEFGARVITQGDPEYPALLKEIHDPPIVLYAWGELMMRDHQAVGVVGSRKTSTYGLECAKKLSYQLAYNGLTVVSGLARGIDTAAHQGALAAKGRTVAVIGSGLMKMYPPENAALAEKIAASGAVLTEFPMLVSPEAQNFPRRNRIVSGWSNSLLVIEAGLKSGALITAGQAADQGRSVYAVPGPIDRPTSAGSNRLIQQGAKLVMSAADVLEDLRIFEPQALPPENTTPVRTLEFTDYERAVYDAILESETNLDWIAEKSNLPPGVVSSTLLTLEMKRLVKRLPGQHFVKLL